MQTSDYSIKNDCALLGVILLILSGEIPQKRKPELSGELRRLMAEIDPDTFRYCIGHFSLEGMLLAHEAGMAAYRDPAEKRMFYSISCAEMRRSLESLPVDRSKLPGTI